MRGVCRVQKNKNLTWTRRGQSLHSRIETNILPLSNMKCSYFFRMFTTVCHGMFVFPGFVTHTAQFAKTNPRRKRFPTKGMLAHFGPMLALVSVRRLCLATPLCGGVSFVGALSGVIWRGTERKNNMAPTSDSNSGVVFRGIGML